MIKSEPTIHRVRNKVLGLTELIAIALGGMVGGGIFAILGVSVAMIGVFTPLAILLGGGIAALAAYSYIKLALYYKDEGATYSFYKKTFPTSHFSASLVGWWVIFGYISTLALYAYTFASYAISGFDFSENEWIRKIVACSIILIFMLVNISSVKGMGKLEDVMVYSKLLILAMISFVLISHSQTTLPLLLESNGNTTAFSILIVAAITFVAYEGFQLVIHAMNEMDNPEKNIPRAIYYAIAIATGIYVVISLGAILTIPFEDIIHNKEYALASGAESVMGHWGVKLVILGALLATSSAISGTLFGASRLMAVIAKDGYLPRFMAIRNQRIPVHAIVSMAVIACTLILLGSLEIIIEFGSVTFLLVSLLMTYANYRIRHLTASSLSLIILSSAGLMLGVFAIIYYEIGNQPEQMYFILALYVLLTLGAWLYAKLR